MPADSRQDDLRVRGRPVAAAVWPLSAPLSDCSPQLNEGTVANQPVRLGAKTKHRWSLALNGLQSNTMKTLLMAKGQPTYLTKNFEQKPPGCGVCSLPLMLFRWRGSREVRDREITQLLVGPTDYQMRSDSTGNCYADPAITIDRSSSEFMNQDRV